MAGDPPPYPAQTDPRYAVTAEDTESWLPAPGLPPGHRWVVRFHGDRIEDMADHTCAEDAWAAADDHRDRITAAATTSEENSP